MIDRDTFEAPRGRRCRPTAPVAGFLELLEAIEMHRARLAGRQVNGSTVGYRVLLLKLEDALRRLLLTWPASEGELGAMFGEVDALLEGLSEQMVAAQQPAQGPAGSPLH